MILKFILNVLVIGIASVAIDTFQLDSIFSAALLVLLITISNAFILPIIKLLALPVNIFTFGLFNLIINILAIIVIVNSFNEANFTGSNWEQFWTAGLIAIIISIFNSILNFFKK